MSKTFRGCTFTPAKNVYRNPHATCDPLFNDDPLFETKIRKTGDKRCTTNYEGNDVVAGNEFCKLNLQLTNGGDYYSVAAFGRKQATWEDYFKAYGKEDSNLEHDEYPLEGCVYDNEAKCTPLFKDDWRYQEKKDQVNSITCRANLETRTCEVVKMTSSVVRKASACETKRKADETALEQQIQEIQAQISESRERIKRCKELEESARK